MEIFSDIIRTEDFAMRYCRFGQGDRAFVILPGLSVQSVMLSAEAVAQAYASLAERYTVYVLDRREELPSRYSVEEMAEDTAIAMKELGLKDTFLFGASQGGMMAQVIAVRHPELVGKLILGSTACRVPESRFQVLDRWIRLAKEGDRKTLYLDFGEAIYPPEVFQQFRQALIDAADTVTDRDLSRFRILAEGIRGFDISPRLHEIRCPVLVLGVTGDEVLGADAAAAIADKLQGRDDFRIHMYEGYGHAAFDTAPDYRDRILAFLAE